MKPSDYTSMRWMQQRMRYLAYMDNRGQGKPLPFNSQSRAPSGTATTPTGAERQQPAEGSAPSFHR